MDKYQLKQKFQALTAKTKVFAEQSKRRTFSIVVILILLVWIFFPSSMYTPETPGVPVAVAAATQKDIQVDLYASGTAEAYNTVTIKSRVDGHIMEINFVAGQNVAAGDLLFVLDTRAYKVALDQARANLARDQATLKFKQENLKRYASLVKKSYVSESEYELAKSDADAAVAVVQSSQAAVDDAELKLEYCYIRSPINGQTGDTLIKIGSLVKTNDTNLLVVNEISPIKATFSLPEQYWLPIQDNYQKGDVMVEAYSPQDNTLLEKGKLIFMDNTINSATGTFNLKAKFENTNRHLWPGQYVKVYIPLEAVDNAIVVPAQALQESNQGPYVFVIDDDNIASPRTVTVGATVKNETVITSGLTAGETVVIEGQFRLTQGTHVTIKEKTTSSDAASP